MTTCDHCGNTNKVKKYYFRAELPRYGFWRSIFSILKETLCCETRDLCDLCAYDLLQKVKTAFLYKKA